MSANLVVDRAGFIAWTEGILLKRTRTTMVIGDTTENREAEKILKRGGTVMLTVSGKPFSLVRPDKKRGGYVETPLVAEEGSAMSELCVDCGVDPCSCDRDFSAHCRRCLHECGVNWTRDCGRLTERCPLIAAAPDLLEACKAALEDCSMSMASDVEKLVRAAISRAEGKEEL